MIEQLWVEKYRPKTVSEYVFRDDRLKKQVSEWIKAGSIPHMLLAGPAGTGKTSLAKVLMKELEVDDADVLYINASRDNGVDMIRRKISTFSETMPWGDFKIILLDESDHLTPEGQAALRGVMEQYSSVVRFILTCNYPNMIIPAIHSRCQSIYLDQMDETEFTVKIAEILVSENIEFGIGTLDTYIRATYPDLRKAIGTVELNCVSGVLNEPDSADSSTSEWKLKMVALFREGKVKEARQHICKHIRPDEYTETFQFLYRNLDFFGETDDKKDEAVIIIRNGMVKHTQCADPEINLSATIIELEQIGK